MSAQEVEQALRRLVGLPLWGTTRAADMECFKFGAKHTGLGYFGKPSTVGDYALHLQCAWRIVGPMGIVVGGHDVYAPEGDARAHLPGFDWDQPGSTRRDERLTAFFAGLKEPLIVEEVLADSVGGFVIKLTGGFSLEAFPSGTVSEAEHWRLFKPGARGHFVITAD